MGIYDVDYDKEARLQVPVRLRQPRYLAWVRSIVWGVKFLYGLFTTFRVSRAYVVAHNSQVCYMEAVLNDAFDGVSRRIFIGDGPFRDPLYIYRADEERPVWVALESELPVIDYDAPVYIYTAAELADSGVQFVVYYPTGLTFEMEQMRALVEKYRLPGKSHYEIRNY